MRGRAPGATLRMWSGEVDVSDPLRLPTLPSSSGGRTFDKARLLVRVHGEPVGFTTVSVRDESLLADDVLAAIEQDLGSVVLEDSPRGDLFRFVDSTPLTIVVCTRDRPSELATCLSYLRLLEHDVLEILVIDNAPSDGSTRELVCELTQEDERIRYHLEPKPGLSRARNCGLLNAKGELIAFADDDVRVDQHWIKGLLRGFSRTPAVACVTGLVASASLEQAAEQYFDARVWWSSSCKARVYDATSGPADARLHPYAAGQFGTGANCAFRASVLRTLGGFDESLGAGSRSGGGEDLDIFVRVIRAGYELSYEPAALVWHEHRADEEQLSHQLYAYGKGLSAYLTKYLVSRETRLDMLRRLPHGLGHLARLRARSGAAGARSGLDRGLMLAEARGLLSGPWSYLRARAEQDPEKVLKVAP
jgi:GT2 family glycosyltransferase